MSCKKYIALGAVSLFLIIFGIMTYRINKIYPQAEEVPVGKNEKSHYMGVSFVPGELEMYENESEILKVYPELKETMYMGFMEVSDEMRSNNWMVVNIEFKNETDKELSFGEEDIYYWILDIGDFCSDTDDFNFDILNPDYSNVMKPGQTQNVKLIYTVSKEKRTYKELKETDIKIIYCYYPTRNFILYKGE